MAPMQTVQMFVPTGGHSPLGLLIIWAAFSIFLLAPFFSFLIVGAIALKRHRVGKGSWKEDTLVVGQLCALAWHVWPHQNLDEELIAPLLLADLSLCILSIAIATAWVVTRVPESRS